MRIRPRRIALLGVLVALVAGPAAVVGQDEGGWMITIAFGGVGILLVWQRPQELVGWILALIAVAFSSVGSQVPGSASQVVDGRADLGVTLYAWLNAWEAPLFFGLFIALAALFPKGRFPAGHLGLLARIAVAIPIAFSLVLPLGPTWSITFTDASSAEIRLPIALAPDWPGWDALSSLVYPAVLGSLVLSIGTLLIRFRRSTGTERQQFKWLLAALGATLASVVFAFAALLLFEAEGTWIWTPAVIAYPTIPLAILVAVQRYRLYEIDRIISRTVSYLLVTGVLAAVFTGLVISLQALLEGVTQGGTLAVAASTLAAFALFQPVRRRIQMGVDRRFDRSRVDAEAMLGAFVGHIREQVDLDQLRSAVLATSSGAVRPRSAAIWLRSANQDG